MLGIIENVGECTRMRTGCREASRNRLGEPIAEKIHFRRDPIDTSVADSYHHFYKNNKNNNIAS